MLPLENNFFHRTFPSDVFIIDALVMLLDMFDWYKIALLFTIFNPCWLFSTKPILKENSDLTFSFKLFPFLVISMSKTYKNEHIYKK